MPVKKKAAAPAKKSAAKAAAPVRKTSAAAGKPGPAAAAKSPAKKAAAPKAKTVPAGKAAKKTASASSPAVKKTATSAGTSTKKPAARKTAARKTTTRRVASTGLGIPATSLPPAVLPPPSGAVPRGPRDMGPETPGTALARAVADAADMKKAEHIAILDVRGLSMVTDFLVIVSASSMPHLRAIRNEISDRIREDRDEKPHSAQGAAESHWMLLDYGDVVAHIFLEEKRAQYALEDLWSDAPRLPWSPP